MKTSLSSAIYPLRCVGETARAFADFCSVRIGPDLNGSYSLEIFPIQPTANEELLTNEFLNYLLAVSINNHLIDR